jgi:hypothetical protein
MESRLTRRLPPAGRSYTLGFPGEKMMETQLQDAPGHGFSMGRVFGRAFATIAANPAAALGIAFLFGALPLIGYHYLEHVWPEIAHVMITPGKPTPMPMPPHFWLRLLYLFGLIVLNAAIGTVAQGAFAPLVLAQDAERRLSGTEVASFAFRALPMLAVLGLLIGVGTTAASIFLLIPGIIVSLIWAVAGPVLVIEHCGIYAALARSRMLTAGARGRILAILLVVGGVAVGANLLADRLAGDYHGVVDGLFGSGVSVSYLLTKVVADTAITTFLAAMSGALYVELLKWKDGAPTDALREIFA